MKKPIPLHKRIWLHVQKESIVGFGLAPKTRRGMGWLEITEEISLV